MRNQVLDMLKRHAIQVLRQAGHTLDEIGELVDVGKRSVQRVVGEPVITHHDTEQERARRAVADAFATPVVDPDSIEDQIRLAKD